MFTINNNPDNTVVQGNLEKKIEVNVVDPIRNLIPKPPGQAGCGNGYTLAKEMQLPAVHYARILVSLVVFYYYMRLFWYFFGQGIVRVIASHGLDPTKSFMEQDKSWMKVVVSKICYRM